VLAPRNFLPCIESADDAQAMIARGKPNGQRAA
jgi:hypothetical protein